MPLSFGYTLDKFLGKGNSSVETGSEEYFRKDFSIQLEVQVPPLLFFADRSGVLYWITNTLLLTIQEKTNYWQ